MLHIVNNLELPVTLTKSYSLYAGAQDAIVQWWYGHNAVGFLLTGGFLGMMYYFLPKQADQPIWSYRLSIVAFGHSLIAIYGQVRITCISMQFRSGCKILAWS